LILLEKRHFSR